MIAEMLRSGDVDAHVAGTVRPVLRKRHARAVEAVRQFLSSFGAKVRVEGEAGTDIYGGYFLWLELPSNGPDAKLVADRAKVEENLIVAPGTIFEVFGDEDAARFPRNIRICFSWEEEEDVVEGVRRLGRVLQRMQHEAETGQVKEHITGASNDGTGDFK
jgi:DNA-binding transcriptional MocR family regulator